jgi:hypothetical protein
MSATLVELEAATPADLSAKRDGRVSRHAVNACRRDSPLLSSTICLISLLDSRLEASDEKVEEFDADGEASSFNARIWENKLQYSGSKMHEGVLGL